MAALAGALAGRATSGTILAAAPSAVEARRWDGVDILRYQRGLQSSGGTLGASKDGIIQFKCAIGPPNYI